jgi:hypothetical protein
MADMICHKVYELLMSILTIFKKLINNSRGKYRRNECLNNVCKSDKDLSWFTGINFSFDFLGLDNVYF